MPDIDAVMLETMTSRELLELQAMIHDAIRAQIRMQNAQRAAAAAPRPPSLLPQVEQSRQRSLAAYAGIRETTEAEPAPKLPAATIKQPQAGEGATDLERERDAWLAGKRGKTT